MPNMNINPLIKRDIRPLTKGADINLALEALEQNKIQHLPVVEDGFYIGLVSEEFLQEMDSSTFDISGMEYRLPIFSFNPKNHMFDAIAKISEGKLSMLPVVDDEMKYVGYINPDDVVHALGDMLSIKNPGGILVLEMRQNDYHLSRLAQIVESHDGKILASYLAFNSSTHMLEVTLRISLEDLSGIIQTMQRYNYTILQVFHRSDHDLDLMSRYENFMKFLNM